MLIPTSVATSDTAFAAMGSAMARARYKTALIRLLFQICRNPMTKNRPARTKRSR